MLASRPIFSLHWGYFDFSEVIQDVFRSLLFGSTPREKLLPSPCNYENMIEDKAENLWRWFYHNEARIRSCMEKATEAEEDEIVDRLNNLVLEMGVFTWEIGQGTSTSWSFTLSPNGDPNLLPLSKEIISMAPQLPEWEFFASKQPKDWDRFFIMYDFGLEQHEINASDWEFAAFALEDHTIELIFKAPSIQHLDEESRLLAADTVILHEIGEEIGMNFIDRISVVDTFDTQDMNAVLPIAEMKTKIASLLPS